MLGLNQNLREFYANIPDIKQMFSSDNFKYQSNDSRRLCSEISKTTHLPPFIKHLNSYSSQCSCLPLRFTSIGTSLQLFYTYQCDTQSGLPRQRTQWKIMGQPATENKG